jgi:hypothetical protein
MKQQLGHVTVADVLDETLTLLLKPLQRASCS